MKSINWVAALSLSVGVTALAGCGQTPTAPTSKAPAATAPAAATAADFAGGLAAQEGVAAPTGGTTTAPAAPAAAPMVPVPAAPASGGTATAPDTTTAPAAPAAGTPPAAPVSDGVLGDARLGGIGGGIAKGLDRGLGMFDFGANALVAFQSDRKSGGGKGFDIFVYDALAQTVLALPAVNTYADETNPRLSANGAWLIYQTDEAGSEDIRVFDLRTQLIDTLRTLNTEEFDEAQPDISDDGNLIVYVSNEGGGGLSGHGGGKHHDHFRNSGDSLRLYNTHNGANFIVPVANRGLTDISWPSISGNGAVIAYGAAAKRRDLDERNKGMKWGHMKAWDKDENRLILMYSVLDAAQLTPPFVNDADADQGNPDLNALGDRIVFVSNRRGSDDIYMTDLRSGFTDNMVLANSKADEQEPRFLGPIGDRVVFQTDRAYDFRIMVYDFPTGLLDTLPVANEVGSSTQLRDEHPAL
ncbi:MAG: hypothetical protein JWM80_1537 [Cyanobacteria bacterium RYN_339]|nr:hypothetical protein [Cyanobacteria bacterium RYN_339]